MSLTLAKYVQARDGVVVKERGGKSVWLSFMQIIVGNKLYFFNSGIIETGWTQGLVSKIGDDFVRGQIREENGAQTLSSAGKENAEETTVLLTSLWKRPAFHEPDK